MITKMGRQLLDSLNLISAIESYLQADSKFLIHAIDACLRLNLHLLVVCFFTTLLNLEIAREFSLQIKVIQCEIDLFVSPGYHKLIVIARLRSDRSNTVSVFLSLLNRFSRFF